MRILNPYGKNNAFITEWNITSGDEITLPLGASGSYGFDVDWGDGSTGKVGSFADPQKTHTYTSTGTFTITIRGQMTAWAIANDASVRNKITKVLNWGDTGLTAMNFEEAENLVIEATDVLDTSNFTSFYRMFKGCSSVTTVPNINEWNTSNVQSFLECFWLATSFNEDLDNWDMTGVDTGGFGIRSMFLQATAFNGAVNAWDTSNIGNMRATFASCPNFNQPLDNWDVSNVTDFTQTFSSATSFNQDITGWTFKTTGSIVASAMFGNANSFNQNIGAWNTERFTTFSGMFNSADNFNNGGSPSINDWDTGNVTQFTLCFANCPFNQPINNWNVGSGSTFTQMFFNNSAFNQDLNLWVFKSTGTITTNSMFNGASSFNGDITTWNTGAVVNMNNMFNNADAFNQNLNTSGSTWDVSSVADMNFMFANTAIFNGTLTGWDTISCTNMSNMFNNADGFDQPLAFNTSSVLTLNSMFANAAIFNQNLNTSGSIWDVSSVTNFGSMFNGALLFNGTLTGWNTTSATEMGAMFSNSNFNQPINGFDMNGVTSTISMFIGTPFDQPLNLWDVSTIETFRNMFQSTPFNQDISGWITTSVNNLDGMFENNTAFNQDISGWDVDLVTDFRDVFRNNSAFNQNLGSWNISSATLMANFGLTSNFSTANWDLMISAWEGLASTPSNITITMTPGYTQSAVDSGTTDGQAANKLIDSTQTDFLTTVSVNDIVHNTTNDTFTEVTAVDGNTQLSLDNDIMASGESYVIQSSQVAKDRYSLLNTYNWTILDGGGI